MAAKITIEFAKLSFEERDLILLEHECKSAHTKMRFICNKHIEYGEMEITWNNFKKGQGCKLCGRARSAKSRKLTFDFVKEKFENRNYILLENGYIDAKSKMRYKCLLHPEYEQKINYANFSQGKGCSWCSNCVRGNIELVKNEFNKRGFVCLTEKYLHEEQPIEFSCNLHPGIAQSISFRSLKNGVGCRLCTKERMRRRFQLDYDFVKNDLKEKGMELLEETYINARTKMKYICESHPFEIQESIYANMKRQSACKYCGREKVSGENSYYWQGGITKLAMYLRSCVRDWSFNVMTNNDFKCAITGIKGELEVHHIKNFSDILKESLNELNLPIQREVGDYSKEDLASLELRFLERHTLDIGVPLLKDIHDLFHKLYGRFNNTSEQFYEFKNRYLSGEFNYALREEALFV